MPTQSTATDVVDQVLSTFTFSRFSYIRQNIFSTEEHELGLPSLLQATSFVLNKSECYTFIECCNEVYGEVFRADVKEVLYFVQSAHYC